MSHTQTIDTRPAAPPADNLLTRHPLLSFVVPVIAATWAVQLTFLALGLPLFPALVIELVILVTAAVTVTRRLTGRPGLRPLAGGALQWRFGIGWYALAVLAMPAVTLVVAWASGTLDASRTELTGAALSFAFLAVVYGAVLGNVWEELAWTGFLQSRLMERHGLFVGSMITAVPFALIHLPLIFEADGLGGTSLREFGLGVLILAGAAPFLRYLIGVVHTRTDRSLLAVALLHGSFNASSSSALHDGDWQYVVAMAVLSSVVALAIRVREGSWA